MKKILLLILISTSILVTQSSSNAEEIGLGNIVFEEKNLQSIEHGIFTTDLSYIITKLHLVIAGKDLDIINYQWEILDTIKKLEELTKTDIIKTLDLAPNKEVALTTYLRDCEQEIQKWEIVSTYLKQEMQIFKSDMEACLTDKNISDKSYFDAVERYDQHIMDTSLTESIKYENCATENRIQYNAKVNVTKKLVFYLGLLQKKYDMLFEKQDIVTKNFTVFRDNILPDLNEIDILLEQYDF